MFEPILTGTMADMASIKYPRQHVFQPTRQLQDRSKLLFLKGSSVVAISTTSAFEVLKFSHNFSPLGCVGFSLRAWPLGRGSRGSTPLHFAARKGAEPVVQRLLEAKAAVDAENNDGRGLGPRIWGGKTS